MAAVRRVRGVHRVTIIRCCPGCTTPPDIDTCPTPAECEVCPPSHTLTISLEFTADGGKNCPCGTQLVEFSIPVVKVPGSCRWDFKEISTFIGRINGCDWSVVQPFVGGVIECNLFPLAWTVRFVMNAVNSENGNTCWNCGIGFFAGPVGPPIPLCPAPGPLTLWQNSCGGDVAIITAELG